MNQPGPVPPRALAVSLAALAVPVASNLLFPDALAEYGVMLWLLALVPAFLLAYYRGWQGVTTALSAGMGVLAVTQVGASLAGRTVQDWPLFFLVVLAYIAIALGIGWLTDMLGDVTERHRQEETRRELEKALETMQLGVTITDTSGKIRYANPADARQHGYEVEELIGQDVSTYARARTRKQLTLEELKALSSWKRETTNVRKDGSVFPVYLASDVVCGVTGDPIAVVTTCEDITERKRAERELTDTHTDLRKSHTDLQLAQLQLIEAEKMESIGRLAAGVAHEVKNPLMTLLTGVKFLSKRLGDEDENVTILLADMAEAVTRADQVIKGLLDFSAPRALELASHDLNAVAERSLTLVKHEIARAKVTVVREFDDQLPKLPLDAFKIQQVLVNLLTNAAHATPPGGTITIGTAVRALALVGRNSDDDVPNDPQSTRRAVFLKVEDNGSGIAEDKLTKIFDPFFTTKPTGRGTGLGLSVTRQIVEMHGGTIHIGNRSEGGARATVVFNLDTEGDENG